MSAAQKPGFACCAICGHQSVEHTPVCGNGDCDCICSIAPGMSQLPDVAGWAESALMAVIDLILDEREGEVVVPTKKGTECRVKVRFVPDIGFSMVKGGRS